MINTIESIKEQVNHPASCTKELNACLKSNPQCFCENFQQVGSPHIRNRGTLARINSKGSLSIPNRAPIDPPPSIQVTYDPLPGEKKKGSLKNTNPSKNISDYNYTVGVPAIANGVRG